MFLLVCRCFSNRCLQRRDFGFQLVSLLFCSFAGHVSFGLVCDFVCQCCGSVAGLVGERQEGLCRSCLLGRVVLVCGPFCSVFVLVVVFVLAVVLHCSRRRCCCCCFGGASRFALYVSLGVLFS